mgnify:CR=1 FL=1
MEREVRRGGLVGPLILIGLGVIFLLNNLELLDWSIWRTLLRLWPLLLIAIGIDILIGRRSIWGTLFALVLIVAVFVGGFLLLADRTIVGQVLTSEEINQPLDGAMRAKVILKPAAGNLRLKALPKSASLIEGTVRQGPGEKVVQDFQVEGKTATFTLRTKAPANVLFPGVWDKRAWQEQWVWDLSLNPDVPLQLEVGLAAGEANLDLTGLTLTELEASIATGKLTVTLPQEGRFRAKVAGAIGELIIIIPRGMEARIKGSTALGDRDMPSLYRRDGDYYTSLAYAEAESSVDLDVGLAIGKISVRQGE